MIEKYEGVVVQDHLNGTGLRHLFVEPPIDNPKLQAAIEKAARIRHISSDGGWTRFVVDRNNYATDSDILDRANAAVGEYVPGSQLTRIKGFEDTVSWTEFHLFVTRRDFKSD